MSLWAVAMPERIAILTLGTDTMHMTITELPLDHARAVIDVLQGAVDEAERMSAGSVGELIETVRRGG